jgi:hypothetical protein
LALIEEVHAHLEEVDVADSTHCVAVFGTAGVGKSTVVSLLFGGGKLRVHHENPFSRVLVAEKPLCGVEIRSGSVSKTLLPGVVHARVNGERVVVFDMPGSQDTRGPFAKLVVHSIIKRTVAKYKTIHALLVASPTHNRPQRVALARAINGAGGSNAVLVYTKADSDFDPRSTEVLEGIDPDKRDIPAYALRKPAASVQENHDYSSDYESTKRNILDKLLRPVTEANAIAGSVPASAELLVQRFATRILEGAREALSASFLDMSSGNFYRSFGVISEVVAARDSPQKVEFMNMMETLQLVLPQSCCLRADPAVRKAATRIDLMQRWTGTPFLHFKDEWLTEEGRVKLDNMKHSLKSTWLGVRGYEQREKRYEDVTMVIAAWDLSLSVDELRDIEANAEQAWGLLTVVLIGFSTLTLEGPLCAWANVIMLSPVIQTGEIDLSVDDLSTFKPRPPPASPGKDGHNGGPGLPGGNLSCLSRASKCRQRIRTLDVLWVAWR